MRRHLLIPLIFLLTACANGPTEPALLPGLVTVTPEPATATLMAEASFTPLATPTALEIATVEPPPTFTLALSPTPAPTATSLGPTPTETLLPPLELPTEKPFAPARLPWTGLPTYPGDSDPGLLFRMDYDPDLWAQTEGNYGEIVLGHRNIPYCTLAAWSGRGLPGGMRVEHEFRALGNAHYDINTITLQTNVQFVTYVGGDGHVLTGFQVSFETQKEQCLQDAEAILGTLRSLSATPTATP
jgi:hypothetical protein